MRNKVVHVLYKLYESSIPLFSLRNALTCVIKPITAEMESCPYSVTQNVTQEPRQEAANWCDEVGRLPFLYIPRVIQSTDKQRETPRVIQNTD